MEVGYWSHSSFKNCLWTVLACFLLSVFYVLSLYMWNSPYHRDHPSTIKKRFLSVFLMMFISPIFTYLFSNNDFVTKYSIWEVLGLRVPGLFTAATIPLILTMILFLGPLAMQSQSGLWDLYCEPMYWYSSVKNLIWLRNHIVAPLSEEFTFRACMLPLLVQCFRPQTAIFVCPLFFGIAHLHHIIGRVNEGIDLKSAVLISGFQFVYTTLFGAYSAFLFLRTGHFIAPFLAHAFCNHMGFPQFSELLMYEEPKRTVIMCLCLVGLLVWCFLLSPLTNPSWYCNSIFWKVHAY